MRCSFSAHRGDAFTTSSPTRKWCRPKLDALDTTTDVETPEHIRFRHRAAGPARRALAWLLDAIIQVGLFFVLTLLLLALGIMTGGLGGLGIGLIMLIAFAIEW